MSAEQRFITIRVRWEQLRRPWCWLHGHAWDQFFAMSVWHSNDWFCKRCGLQRPAGRRERDADGTSWYQALDADGGCVGDRMWRSGPFAPTPSPDTGETR